MLKSWFNCVLIFLVSYFITALTDGMIGPGRWVVIHIQKCPEHDKYPFRFDLSRRKVNRTHDGFSGWLELDVDLDETFAVRVEICKHVDGGCKPYQILADDCFCDFMSKYAKENVEKCYIQSGIPLPLCPLRQGRYEISNYVFNYEELPENGIYGVFGATEYLLRDGQVVSCVELTVRFESDKGQR